MSYSCSISRNRPFSLILIEDNPLHQIPHYGNEFPTGLPLFQTIVQSRRSECDRILGVENTLARKAEYYTGGPRIAFPRTVFIRTSVFLV